MDSVHAPRAGTPIALVGDFNIDTSSSRAAQLTHLQHFCGNFCILNHVTESTRVGRGGSRTTIDLLLAEDGAVGSCRVLPHSLSDHLPILATLAFEMPTVPVLRSSRNTRGINLPQLCQDLVNSRLEDFSTAKSLEDMWQLWYDKVTSLLDRHAPVQEHRLSSSRHQILTRSPWKTAVYHDAVRERNHAHHRWLRKPTDTELYDTFSDARKAAKRLARQLKSSYYTQLLDTCQSNPRKAWKVLNDLCGRKKSSTPTRLTASALNAQFSSVVSDPQRPDVLSQPEGPGIADGLNRFEPATCEEVLALLLKVDERKATGSDGIPCYVLRHCARVLAPSLTILMNASLAMGKVPMMLRLAHIRPIFKAGDPETAKNYRPISLLPVVSKILESIVHKRLCVLLTEHDLLPAEQFAYRAHHSTEDAVLLAVDQFYEAADQHLHTGVVLIDMSKAFDKVQHQTLLQDLFELGVSSTALDWFADYLSARRQCVVTANGTRSEETACTCGVPQGSVLGPILFAIYTIVRDVSHQ